jgi:hypothetical protein
VVTVVDGDGDGWWWPFDGGDAAALGWSTMVVVRRKALLIVDDAKSSVGVCRYSIWNHLDIIKLLTKVDY